MESRKALKHPPYYAIKAYEILAKKDSEEIANLLGITPRTYWNKVNGQADFSVQEAAKLAEILGRSTDDIFLV